MAVMLCYSESVEADTPPPTPSCIPTTHLARAAVLCCCRVSFSVAQAAASPPTIRQTRHPRNRTFETMAIMLIRVGMCSNNRSLGIHYLVYYNYKYDNLKKILMAAMLCYSESVEGRKEGRKRTPPPSCIPTTDLTRPLGFTFTRADDMRCGWL